MAAVLIAAVLVQGVDARGVRKAAVDTRCAKPQEVTAVQVASVQQELMVAALTCNAVSDFNAFQTAFHADLQTSDKRLADMFRRIFGRKGEAEYHAFKTRLANNDSMRAIHDADGYCQEAKQVFTAAQTPAHPELAEFVSTVGVHEDGPVNSCDMKVANGLPSPVLVAEPEPNPMRQSDSLASAPASASGEPAPASPKR